jgi:hypothetical protein
MKRILPLVLLLVLVLPLLSACGTQTEPKPLETVPPFQETVLLDNELCAVTVTDVTVDEIWGLLMKVHCENKTEATVFFNMKNPRCQAWVLNADWVQELGPGENVDSEFNVFAVELQRCGLSRVDEFRFQLVMTDAESEDGSPLVNEEVAFSPTGADLEKLEPLPLRKSGKQDVELVNSGSAVFTVCGTESDSIWPYNLILYMYNKSEKDLSFTWRDISVNGVSTNPWFFRTVPAGCQSCMLVYFNEDIMKENGVEQIKKVEFTLVLQDPETYETLEQYQCSYVPKK